MIVAGRVTRRWAHPAPAVRPDAGAKWVISMGDCASCGGVFNNYAIVQGVDEVVPVDVYWPAARRAPRRCSMVS